MNTGQELTLGLFVQIVQAVGTIGVLCWLVWQFNKGSLIPKPTADKLIQVYQEAAEKTFTQILERLDKIIVVCPLGFSNEDIRRAVGDALDQERERRRGKP
jgi:hypothetical protein